MSGRELTFAERVVEKSVGELRTFLNELENGSANYRTVHNLTVHIEHQYRGRFAVELLQNCHDQLKFGGSRGRIELAILDDGSEHGALYVANDGREFLTKDFTGLSRLGDSPKNPEGSTGNKGLGFRSVLELTSAPEIYSCRNAARGVFDGYCFRFDPACLSEVRTRIAELLAGAQAVHLELGDERVPFPAVDVDKVVERCRERDVDPLVELTKLSPYLLPLPCTVKGGEVQAYAEARFASVMRLPFKDAEARSKASKALDAIQLDGLVFLEALDELTLRTTSSLRKIRRSRPVRREGPIDCDEIVISEGATSRRFWRWTRSHGNSNATELQRIREAVAELPEKWKDLSNVVVAAAVAIDGQPLDGRYYIDLGTNDETGIHAHLNAPFFGDLSREHLKLALPLNALLVEWLRALVNDIVRKDLVGKSVHEAIAILDLVAPPSSSGAESILRRYDEVPLILCDDGWKSPRVARLLPRNTVSAVVTEERLRRAAAFSIVERRVDVARRGALDRLLGTRAQPNEQELALAVARIADELRTSPDASWERFWADVQHVLPNARALVRQRVLLDETGALRAPEDPAGPRVFFPPNRADGEDATTPPPSLEVPPALKGRLAFLSSAIPVRRSAQRGGLEQTPARKYLDPLVHEYDVESIFRLVLIPALPVGHVALGSAHAERCAEILTSGVALVESARQAETLVPLLAKLRVPCVGGWFVANEVALGPDWPDSHGTDLEAYLSEAATPEAEALRNRLLLGPQAPEWRGAARSIERRRAALEIFDGLPLDGQKWVCGPASIGQRAKAMPRTAPAGLPDQLWMRYANDVETRLEWEGDLFKNPHEYEILDQRRFPGMGAIERLSADGRAALMRLLVGSIGKWRHGWRKAALLKLTGETHTIEIESILSFYLRTVPWICFSDREERIGCTPSDRWLVPSIIQPGQRRQFDHIEPLPPDVTKLILRSPDSLPPLGSLGLRTYDVQMTTTSRDVLETLAAAHARVDPTIRDVYVGQLKDAWHVFSPGDAGDLPRTVVVTVGGRQLRAVTPTVEDPIYLPDDAVATDAGTAYGALPVVAISRQDAQRLAARFLSSYGLGARLLSRVKLEAWSGDTPWTPSSAAVPLMTSSWHWLAPFALTVAAFAGNAYGTQTPKFRESVAGFRAARIQRVEGLGVQLTGATDACRHPRQALWEPSSKTVLYDTTAPGWLEALAAPLQTLLLRNDLAPALRLALSKLEEAQDEPPSDTALEAALASVDVTPANLAEVKRSLLGDLPFIVERLRPAFVLLAPDRDPAVLSAIASEDEARAILDDCVGRIVPSSWLLDRCREAQSDTVLGHDLFQRLGDAAELERWNHALRELGPPYSEITNKDWAEQVEHHVAGAAPALRAIARRLAHEGRAAFPVVAGELEGAKGDESLARRYWSIPFHEALRSRRAVLEKHGASESVLDALARAADAEALMRSLRDSDVALDFDRDPAELLEQNRRACKRCIDTLQKIAAVWYERRKGAALPTWGREPSAVRAGVEKELGEGLGYLDPLDETTVYALVRKHLRSADIDEALWGAIIGAVDVTALALALDMTESDLARAGDVIEADRDRKRKEARSVFVCGSSFDPDEANLHQLWDHIRSSLTDDSVSAIDLSDLAVLEEMKKRARPKREVRPSGNSKKFRVKRPAEGVLNLVGLAGEIHVYRALLKTFGPEIITPSCWKSGLSRNCFSTNDGDDSLGHDFVVRKGRKAFLLEVKSTREPPSDIDEIELGVSELRCAEENRNDKTRIFRIVRVFDALSSQPTMIVLPNPHSDQARGLYDIHDANYRLRFRRSSVGPGGLHT